MKNYFLLLGLLVGFCTYSQVGINTENPLQLFHVDGQKDNPATGSPDNAQQLNDVVITENGHIGIGTNNPARSLDIEGTARLSQVEEANKPNKLGYTHSSVSGNPTDNTAKPIYGKDASGQLVYAPDGFTTVVGGYRPWNHTSASRTMPIKNFPVNSPTIARVKFVHYPKSSATNNSKFQKYTYGEFTVICDNIANSSVYEIKIIGADVKGYNGSPKTLTVNNDNTIEWSLEGTERARIVLNQTTGELGFYQHTGIYNYFFEVLGGI